jgi:hypothetical protein
MTTLLLAALFLTAPEGEIRHRFLAVDESRQQLIYVDQYDTTKNWRIVSPVKRRDIQLIGQGRVLWGGADGYCEYRLSDQRLMRELTGYPGVAAARRQADGRTILACNEKAQVSVYELNAENRLLRKATFPVPSTRLLRMTPQGTFLFGAVNQIVEGDFQGRMLHTITLAKGSWAYQILRRGDGHLLLAAGYQPCLLELDPAGNIVHSIGGKDAPEGKTLGLHFFAGFQILANGNRVVSNWTGHGPQDSQKGVQLLEYSPQGKRVWQWHDPQFAGSLDAVIVLDGLDLTQLHDDVTTVLGPVKAAR